VSAQEVQRSETGETDEEVLADGPTDLSMDDHSNEAVRSKADGGFVVDAVLEIETGLAVQP
jgi:hypothetical protein